MTMGTFRPLRPVVCLCCAALPLLLVGCKGGAETAQTTPAADAKPADVGQVNPGVEAKAGAQAGAVRDAAAAGEPPAAPPAQAAP